MMKKSLSRSVRNIKSYLSIRTELDDSTTNKMNGNFFDNISKAYDVKNKEAQELIYRCLTVKNNTHAIELAKFSLKITKYSSKLQHALLDNPHLPEEAVLVLLKSRSTVIKSMALQRLTFSKKELVAATRSDNPVINASAISNSATPQTVRTNNLLSKDPFSVSVTLRKKLRRSK